VLDLIASPSVRRIANSAAMAPLRARRRLVPVTDPVQRARNRKGGKLDVARPDRSVLDPLPDIVAKGPVDLLLGEANDLAVVLGEVADVETHQALAVVGGHGLGVADNQLAQFLQPGATGGGDFIDALVDTFGADRPAFVEDFVLACGNNCRARAW
jgi:hypothetical protein